MGYSVRTESWRATFWMWWDKKRLVGDFSRPPAAIELYDHHHDRGSSNFDLFENDNVFRQHPDVVHSMLELAKQQWGKGG